MKFYIKLVDKFQSCKVVLRVSSLDFYLFAFLQTILITKRTPFTHSPPFVFGASSFFFFLGKGVNPAGTIASEVF